MAALDDLRAAATAAEQAAEQAAELSDSLYRSGLTDFQNVLDMQRQLASNRDALSQGVGAAAAALVDVWKAFAGPDTQSPAATEESHAESAENAEPESHAEFAENAESESHAENAETAEPRPGEAGPLPEGAAERSEAGGSLSRASLSSMRSAGRPELTSGWFLGQNAAIAKSLNR